MGLIGKAYWLFAFRVHALMCSTRQFLRCSQAVPRSWFLPSIGTQAHRHTHAPRLLISLWDTKSSNSSWIKEENMLKKPTVKESILIIPINNKNTMHFKTNMYASIYVKRGGERFGTAFIYHRCLWNKEKKKMKTLIVMTY